MKRVVSVSAGSSKRDKAVEAEFLGESFSIERVGTDGDLVKFAEKMRELDGKVDAIGLGGVDLYIYSEGKRYAFRQVAKLAMNAKKTPVVDGSGLKNTLEKRTIQLLQERGIIDFPKSKVLMVSGVDRFGMADALRQIGCDIVFGDLMFSMGIPIPLRSWRALRLVARALLPVIVLMPLSWLYPMGEKQEKITPKYEKYYRWADVIAGDFHFIKKHMPDDLTGKVIITNTTTEEDVKALKQRGVRLLITSTPEFSGRSFGTNVMEGVLLALSGKSSLTPEEYLAELEKIGWEPRISELAAVSV